MLKSNVVKTVNFFLPARKKHIRTQSTQKCTWYTSACRILRNSKFSCQAAKCERAVCKQGIALPAENRHNEEKPSITLMAWCWASFLSCFGAFFEDKIACVLFAFLCHIDTLPSVPVCTTGYSPMCGLSIHFSGRSSVLPSASSPRGTMRVITSPVLLLHEIPVMFLP